MQLAAFAVVLNVPLAHDVHVRSLVGVPPAPIDCPGEQLVHGMHAVAELPSWSHVPVAHAVFGASLPAQYVPASHGAQTAGENNVAGAVCTVPAAHTPAGRQLVSLGDDVYVPDAHAVHWRSDTALGAALT